MKTSLIGKLILLISMAVQGVIFRKMFSNVIITIDYELIPDQQLDHPVTIPPASAGYDVVEDASNEQEETSDELPEASTSEATTNTPQLQIDLMVPVYERDDRLRIFATNLGKAVSDYRNLNNDNSQLKISTFRLLVTRFSKEEQAESDSFKEELAKVTNLPLDHIVMVKANDTTTFSRARALNMLHEAACHLETCLITRLDVDMEVRQEFFQHSIETVYLKQVPPTTELNKDWAESDLPEDTPVAYFPIVWSAYNPESVVLVEKKFKHELRKENPKGDMVELMKAKMPEFSEHRGHWRPYGKGMYVISGTDALKLTYDTSFEGWGGEDVDFYERTVALPRRILRRVETGLIHQWHPKFCDQGKDAFTPDQIRNCRASVRKEEGSDLGQQLLWNHKQALQRAAKQKAAAKKTTSKPAPKKVFANKPASSPKAASPTTKVAPMDFDVMDVALPVATHKRPLVLNDEDDNNTNKPPQKAKAKAKAAVPKAKTSLKATPKKAQGPKGATTPRTNLRRQ